VSTHRLSKTPTYARWLNMRSRCNNKNATQYPYYGGRGITYDPRWNNFAVFLADMGECPLGFTLERKLVNGNYEKTNCCWIPKAAQARNTRRNRYVELDGEQFVLADLCERFKLRSSVVSRRLSRNWTVRQALGIDEPPPCFRRCVGSSGIKGVSYFKRTGKWGAYIFLNGKAKSLGFFSSKEEASTAYANAIRENYPAHDRHVWALGT
jgi:hypothetical protein